MSLNEYSICRSIISTLIYVVILKVNDYHTGPTITYWAPYPSMLRLCVFDCDSSLFRTGNVLIELPNRNRDYATSLNCTRVE